VEYPIQNILEAAHYAAEKHSGQRRKGEAKEPYINHLLEVAKLAARADPDPNLIIAALLHDTVEDQGVTPKELTERFGADVAALVIEVTDDKSLPKEERKRLQIANAPHKSRRAQIIKLADKISNLRSILTSPPAGWDYDRKRQYFDWANQVVSALPSPDPGLKAEFDRAFGALPKP
jgi:guanosine-3',5'-bis(diphosphate) 3'-pyrophosphohydrolase